MQGPVIFSAAVEGIVDEAVARKIVAHVGGQLGEVYGKNGKSTLRKTIRGYNNAAKHAPWLILVDLNSDADCAPALCQDWLAAPASMLCFRVAVPQVEAWLMADPESLASFLSVARSRFPDDPERLPNAKTELVNLVRRSRRQAIRQDMVPREGSGRSEGPSYASRLIEFVDRQWRPDIAARRADSLRRAIACLKRLIGKFSA